MPTNDVTQETGDSRFLKPPGRLRDDLYLALVKMIEEELPPGSRLPSEVTVAERFGVSRPTVRETLARMREEGIISSRRGSGSYVSERVSASAQRVSPTFSPINSFQQIGHAYDYRKAVEGEAAYFAALNASEAQLQAIRLALADLEKAVEQRASSGDTDFAFHLAVAQASGNNWFVEALEAMSEQVNIVIDIARKLSLGKSEAHLRAVQNEHVAIFDAIARKEADSAREAMRMHLSNTCERIFRGQSV